MATKELPMDEDGQPPKRSKKRLIFILLFLLLLAAGGGLAAWHFLFGGQIPFLESAPTEAQTAATNAATPQDRTQPVGNVVPLPPFTVNLADPLGRRILTVTLSLEMADNNAITSLKKQEPRVRDAIIMLLSSKTYGDISSPDSKMVLKSEITSRVNQILGGQPVMQTFITDILTR